MVDTLNSIDANYTVAAGTVLSWYSMNNLEKLDAALVSAGWTKIMSFGKPGIIGYELQAWKKKGFVFFCSSQWEVCKWTNSC